MTEASVLLTEVRRELARLPPLLDLLVGELDGATWRARPAPDEWAPVEIICHLRDEETEDFGARVRVILKGGTRFAPNDPDALAVAAGFRGPNRQEPRPPFKAGRKEGAD